MIEPLYALAGMLVGLLVGITGVGGGSLMTPILVLLFNFHPATAVGTDLLFAATTKTAGSAVHNWRQSVDWRIVRRLASGSVPAAALTLLALDMLGDPSKRAAHLITVALGVTLLTTAVAVLFQRQMVAFVQHWLGRNPAETNPWPTVMFGAVLGSLVSITSVGAGAIGVTVLLILYPSLPVSRIVGSDIAHAVPLTLVAGIGHWIIGNVDSALLISLLCGSIPGVLIGSYIGSGASDRVLRPALSAVLLIVGGRLLT